MKKVLNHKPVRRLLVLLVLDAIVFGTTHAATAPSYMIIIGFILFVLTIYYVFYNLLAITSLYGLKIKHKHQMSLYITIVLGILIALQSTGELGSRDVWVLLPLVILGYFYSTYARSTSL